jgi:hypothetical protein
MLPNRCMECGEICRQPKRFCCEDHKVRWFANQGFAIDYRGVAQVAAERGRWGSTPEQREWKRKLSLSKEF